MARDAELDRLKTAQDLAFQHKQNAWQAQDNAWKRLSSARDTMNRAHEEKQRAYEQQDQAWQYFLQTKNYNGPRIDQLNALQETAYQNMRRAFENASAAYDRRDGASAKMYADQGHSYKAESQRYVAERRQLVEAIRQARAQHEATKPAFQSAKARFDQAKREYDQAKADHERRKAEFNQAKAEDESAREAFRRRLEQVKAQGKRKRDDKRDIARRAGVPSQYLDNVWISTDTDGNTNIYFGGAGEPNGPGHGHYVVDRRGKVTYRRDPSDSHGQKNFADDDAYIQRQRNLGHVGGFGLPVHGWIDGYPVTAAFGWGTKAGETLLADGHIDAITFRSSTNHNHYGSGKGPHGNVADRFKYSGPGA